ncbi:MAG: nitrous oxide reductase family maturation protein NosD [Gemmatimonadaceae bacterium]
MKRALLLTITTLAIAAPSARAQRVLDVSPSGPLHRVSDAIAAASPGDTVVIHAGTYREPLISIAKRLTIVGDGQPVLDGGGSHGLLLVTADDVTVRGLVLRNVGTSFVDDRAAIKVDNARFCSIDNNRIENAFFGIYLARVTDCRVTYNEIRGAATRETEAGNGIHLWTSRRITIIGNDISGHRDGIYFEFVHDSDIHGNTSEWNVRYGLHFMYSDGCRYLANTFRHNGSGVAVMYTKGVTMTANHFEDNWGPASYGLLLKEISDATLERNVFAHNTTGLLADGANRIVALRNEFRDNGWAVRLDASTVDGEFTLNNFIGNSFDVTTNSRFPSTRFSGNYWDDYRGYDLDHDGSGDVPFRPVRLFSVIVEKHAASLILMHSAFTSLLDAAERVVPSLTPDALADARPAMRPIR